jgi:hypothetical protein
LYFADGKSQALILLAVIALFLGGVWFLVI